MSTPNQTAAPDPVDAANDAEVLTALLSDRADRALTVGWPIATETDPTKTWPPAKADFGIERTEHLADQLQDRVQERFRRSLSRGGT